MYTGELQPIYDYGCLQIGYGFPPLKENIGIYTC